MKRSIFTLLTVLLLNGCYSHKKALELGIPYNQQINWPTAYQLDKTEFYIHNRIDINTSPEIVWNILIQAEKWPDWYTGMSQVSVVNAENGILRSNSKMEFNTMERNFQGTIKEFKPYERLAWETVNEKLNAYHAWLIVPTEKGCRVITDESQYGKLARLQTTFVPNKLKKLHDIWLEKLKEKAEAENQ
ncbi:MAG: SRPBCC domain-containing protein [Bacteroidota bacterium]